MKHAVIIACWISVVAVGAMLRLDQLSARPFHCDEATGARITAKRMESGGYQFDPVHFHGPTLSGLAIPLSRARGESCWRDMTKGTLRTLPAIAGTLLVLVPLLGRRRWGDGPMLLGAAFLATSPLLVYYSRMFIHESLLVLFGMLALFALLGKPRYGIPGILIGLMFATKESFAISIIAWAGAGVLIALENRRLLDRAWLAAAWRQYRVPFLVSVLTAAATAGFFYTEGFRHPQGAVDAIRTFFVYETTEGHDKPIPYYLELLLLPKNAAGVWWFETPLLGFALLAYALSFARMSSRTGVAGPRPSCLAASGGFVSEDHPEPTDKRPGCGLPVATIRFLAYAAAGHFLIYSLPAYKTPWLACLPWAHVCLLAGFGVAGFSAWRLPLKLGFAVIAGLCLVSQTIQSRQATGSLASDDRNPYAYVPTSQDIESLEPWLKQLAAAAPETPLEPIGVVGTGYWPLPWYLRSFDQVGYWQVPPGNLERLPLVVAVPDSMAAVLEKLGDTHTPVPRGLRDEVPVTLFIRNDIWSRWMASDN